VQNEFKIADQINSVDNLLAKSAFLKLERRTKTGDWLLVFSFVIWT